MTPSDKTATPHQNLNPARPQAKIGGRMLSVVHGKDERSLHLSPILQQIKDDGPALIDGEVLKDNAAAPRLAKPGGAPDAKAAPAATAVPPMLAERHLKVLIGLCAALTIGLAASLWFSWQQQQRLANVEYLLEVLVTTPR